MPYEILKLIENDETLSTCQMFNAEIVYGDGLRYDTDAASAEVKAQVEDFLLSNDLSSYYLGVCQDMKNCVPSSPTHWLLWRGKCRSTRN